MEIELTGPDQRFCTHDAGRTTWHAFSFGAHYDPTNVGFAQLVALNDEHLPTGNGYSPHPHSGIDIVTVVLEGALEHASDVGSGVITPGQVQRLSAGSGVVHSEMNAANGPTRFLQAWVQAKHPDRAPAYAAVDLGDNDGWTRAAGSGDALLSLDAHLDLWLAPLAPGESLALPDLPTMLLCVTTGTIVIDKDRLDAGGLARIRGAGGVVVEALTQSHLALWTSSQSA